jgi:putative inorganic carbon (hco3(-)) transporter
MESGAGFSDPSEDNLRRFAGRRRVMQAVATRASGWERPRTEFVAAIIKAAVRPLHVLVAEPSLLFLAALTAMLLRHPDVRFYEIDRVAFVLLVMGVMGGVTVKRRPLAIATRASLPMLGLTLLVLGSVLNHPFDQEAWSLMAAKFIVPFALFHLAQAVFTREWDFRRFELFVVLVLAYLSFTSIAFLVGAKSLIFPRFILDESLGFHADRARGPLLQAVANGVSLNILGVLALHTYRRGSIRGMKMFLLLASVPLAILATMTRAVWLSFAGTLFVLFWQCQNRRLKRACILVGLIASIGAVAVVSSSKLGDSLSDRFQERGPIDYREAMYAGAWQMFLRHPITGWGFHQMPAELPRFVSGYEEKTLYPHNTYLELLVELGVVGLGLYVWLMWELWRLGRGAIPASEGKGFLDCGLHQLWPVLLAVYWVNAAVVVMSYQFVNGLLFSIAGMLAAQRRRAEGASRC